MFTMNFKVATNTWIRLFLAGLSASAARSISSLRQPRKGTNGRLANFFGNQLYRFKIPAKRSETRLQSRPHSAFLTDAHFNFSLMFIVAPEIAPHRAKWYQKF